VQLLRGCPSAAQKRQLAIRAAMLNTENPFSMIARPWSLSPIRKKFTSNCAT
jgi:hypothetical protein